jgi:hypothetical protein
MPDAATPSATRRMNAESIGAPAPCANKNDFAAVFGPSTSRAVMTIDHRTIVTSAQTESGFGLARSGRDPT